MPDKTRLSMIEGYTDKGGAITMTENEAIRILQCFAKWNEDDHWLSTGCMKKFVECCTESLKEIQKYREIGIVEECREAVEKQRPKVGIVTAGKSYPIMCPICGHKMEFAYHHCIFCGQNLIYYGKMEEMEDE